ncbi:wax ester/triacylglycerol synthase domain-containing protein [Nocardia carnea]|uniref:wax ester/triacylglycerol synthase domain-containing protein n=1 Tax=Nocardia carnea TaxID=37328 RepID=UPI002453D5B8|nr:wax ester/triacylglycerol synthase domain-containing protein [Nocardia carnea]
MISLAAPDATMYWLSRRTRNDQFLLYCFAESDRADSALRDEILQRCAAVPELRQRLHEDRTGLAYPMWIPAEPTAAQIRQHRLPAPHWPELLTALGRLTGTGVDARESPWLLHIFRGIRDSPVPDPQATVVVLQISHALVDGRGAARIARALFTEPTSWDVPAPESPGAELAPQAGLSVARAGEPVSKVGESDRAGSSGREFTSSGAAGPAPVPHTGALPMGHRTSPGVISAVRLASLRAAVLLPVGVARTVRRGLAAARARNELAALTAAGRVPPPGPGYPPGPLNRPAVVAGHAVRMLVCPAEDFRVPGLSVTVVGLTAVSIAVEQYLRGRGAEVTRLGAQVPMALPTRRGVRNNYRSLGVDLAAGEQDPRRRAAAIAAELAARRERARHPLHDAQDAVDAVLPPLLLRRDVRTYPIHSTPEQITGHTVVSSVNRGPADLTFGGAPVRFTGGFPALGAVMHLTHGIHGLGETVTLSVHADPDVVDPDIYAGHLRDALRELPRLRG